jgi:DNA-binding transcriptional LysR family regulator
MSFPEEESHEAHAPVSRLGRSMLSIKQIEAFYWSGLLGSFVGAANRLNTTQSNISKRIAELELTLGIQGFDRSKRAIRLTQKGEEVMRLSEMLLKTHMRLSNIGEAVAGMSGPFRFGVTEAVALTWLPAYLAAITAAYPGLLPEPHIGTSQEMNEALRRREVDLVIGTETNLDPHLELTSLAWIERVAMASPKMGLGGKRLTLEDMARTPMIGHTVNSEGQRLITKAMNDRGLVPNVVITCSSLSARARMAMAGIGIAYLPKDVFAADVAAGRLEIVETEIEQGRLHYVAVHRNDVISPFASLLAEKAREHCDFSAALD